MGPSTCVALAANTDPDRHPPFCRQVSPSTGLLPCSAFVAWSLLGANTNPNPPETGTLQGNLSLPPTLTLQLCCLVAWAVTSALEGYHEPGVTFFQAMSLDLSLTLAKALSPWEPNTKV